MDEPRLRSALSRWVRSLGIRADFFLFDDYVQAGVVAAFEEGTDDFTKNLTRARDRIKDFIDKQSRHDHLPLEDAEATVEFETLKDTIQGYGLTTEAKEMVQLYFEDDFTYHQIARVYGVSYGTVHSRISGAVEQMEKFLRND